MISQRWPQTFAALMWCAFFVVITQNHDLPWVAKFFWVTMCAGHIALAVVLWIQWLRRSDTADVYAFAWRAAARGWICRGAVLGGLSCDGCGATGAWFNSSRDPTPAGLRNACRRCLGRALAA